MPTTELVAVKRGREVLQKTTDLTKVAEAMVADELPVVEDSPEFAKLPESRELTDDLCERLIDVPQVYGKVNMDSRRTLTETELQSLYREREALNVLAKEFEDRLKDISSMVKTHIDVQAEEDGIAVPKAKRARGQVIVPATPRDKDGHYLLARQGQPIRVPVPGTGKAFSEEFRRGKVTINGDLLTTLYELGELDREMYLDLTREMRVLDEVKVAAAMRRQPEEVLEIIKKITSVAPPTAPIYVRKA